MKPPLACTASGRTRVQARQGLNGFWEAESDTFPGLNGFWEGKGASPPSPERFLAENGTVAAGTARPLGLPVQKGAIASMPANRNARTAKKATPNQAGNTPIEAEGSEEALAEFRPHAQKLDSRDIQPMRADAALAYHNIVIGVNAVLSKQAALAKLPAPFKLESVKSLPRLALALLFAARQVDRKAGSPGTTKQMLRRANELRTLLLTAAEALANSKIIPARLVEKIRKGRGVRDLVQDCIDLAALFRKYAAEIAGKTAITKEQIDEAASVGNSLLRVLVPKAARKAKKTPDDVKDAVELRDRLWTLLVTRYREHLRRAGMWQWGDDVDDHVPPLQSRAAASRKSAPVEGNGTEPAGDAQ